MSTLTTLPLRRRIAAAALVAAPLLGGVAIATPASAVTITGVVPNRVVQVYLCSYWTGDCRYQYSYQANGPYNTSVPTVYVRQNNWTWSWF